ncbi:MAG: hypothetical protein WDZ85_03385 [Candidatus Paceibacterota bacterium]
MKNFAFLIAFLVIFGLAGSASGQEAADIDSTTARDRGNSEAIETTIDEERPTSPGQTLQERAREQREAVLPSRALGAPAGSAEREAVRNQLKERIEERIQMVRENQANIAEDRMANRDDKLRQNVLRMLNRIEAAFVRVEMLALRLEERLDIFEADGANVDQPRQTLVEAAQLVSDGRLLLEQAHTAIDSLTPEAGPADYLAAARSVTSASIAKVREAHQMVVRAITEARGMSSANQDEVDDEEAEGDETENDDETEDDETEDIDQ